MVVLFDLCFFRKDNYDKCFHYLLLVLWEGKKSVIAISSCRQQENFNWNKVCFSVNCFFAEVSTHCNLTFLCIREMLNVGHSVWAKWTQYVDTDGTTEVTQVWTLKITCSVPLWASVCLNEIPDFSLSINPVFGLSEMSPLRQNPWLTSSKPAAPLTDKAIFFLFQQRIFLLVGTQLPPVSRLTWEKFPNLLLLYKMVHFSRERPLITNLLRLIFPLYGHVVALSPSVRRAERAHHFSSFFPSTSRIRETERHYTNYRSTVLEVAEEIRLIFFLCFWSASLSNVNRNAFESGFFFDSAT